MAEGFRVGIEIDRHELVVVKFPFNGDMRQVVYVAETLYVLGGKSVMWSKNRCESIRVPDHFVRHFLNHRVR